MNDQGQNTNQTEKQVRWQGLYHGLRQPLFFIFASFLILLVSTLVLMILGGGRLPFLPPSPMPPASLPILGPGPDEIDPDKPYLPLEENLPDLETIEIQYEGIGREVMPNQLIIKVKEGTPESARRSIWQSVGGESEIDLGAGMWLIKLGADIDLLKAIDQLKTNPALELAEPDFIQESFYTPNDYSLLTAPGWWELIKAKGAWDVARGDLGIKLGIIDTATNNSHQDLSGRITTVTDPALLPPGSGAHGTHVSGIASAITDNNIGVASIGFASTIYNYPVCTGSCPLSAIIRGINLSADMGMRVINMSLGGPYPDSAMNSAVQYAWSKGVVIVAAAGNDGGTSRNYPAGYDNVISVAATTNSGSKAGFSTYGSWVKVAAPGVSILSSVPGGYGYMSGTSMASPVVAGLAVLCLSANPGLSNVQVRDQIFNNARSNTFTQYGLVDAEQTLRDCGVAGPPPPPPPPPPSALPCYPSEWQCKGDDVKLPSQNCCEISCINYLRLDHCLTNGPDQGQKDGTGKRGTFRLYPAYDYDYHRVVQAPPVLPTGILPGPGGPSPTPGICGPPSCPITVGGAQPGYRHCATTFYGQKHHGLDILANENTPVYSVSCGTVVSAGWRGSYGYAVKVLGADNNYYYYGHLSSSINVMINDVVGPGTFIGYVGPQCLKPEDGRCYDMDPSYGCPSRCYNGASSEPHLHLEIRDNTDAYSPDDCTYHQIDPITLLPTSCPGLPGSAGLGPTDLKYVEDHSDQGEE